MNYPDVMNWTGLLVILSPLLVALLRRPSLNQNQVVGLTLGVLALLFFAGRLLDGALSWPMSPSLAAEFAAALAGQQVLYQLFRKTPIVDRLEDVELSGPHPGSGLGLVVLVPLAIGGLTFSILSIGAPTTTTAASHDHAALVGLAAPVAALAGHPAGCAAGELFVDSQDWWLTAPGKSGNDFGHLHTSLCFPYNGTLSAKRSVKVVSKMHNNPGEFRRLDVQVFDAAINPCNGDSYAIDCKLFKPVRTLKTCATTGGVVSDGGMTCTWSDVLTLDPARISKGGWQEFRFRGFVREPDGSDMRTSTGLQLDVQNGRAVKNYRTQGQHFTETRGWYEFSNYAVAGSLDFGRIVAGPISGVWSPKVWMKAGSGGVTVTSHYAALDTDFHNGNAGTPIKSGSGPYVGPITIDTTKLSNGWHRLFLRTDQLVASKGSTNSGVFATWFLVQN